VLGNLNGWHLIIILAVVLLLFGAPKLPGLAKSVGQSMRIFRSEIKTMKDENGPADSTSSTDTKTETKTESGADATGSSESKPKL
jgi:sec-independent protein translocase protein TatA